MIGLLGSAVQETELAFLKSGDGDYTVGVGPFEQASAPPDGGTAFYCNDFALSDPCPWKVPDRVEQVASLSDIGIVPDEYEIQWDDPEPDAFAEVFAEINEMIEPPVGSCSLITLTKACRKW